MCYSIWKRIKLNPNERIMVCGPSNTSVRNALSQLITIISTNNINNDNNNNNIKSAKENNNDNSVIINENNNENINIALTGVAKNIPNNLRDYYVNGYETYLANIFIDLKKELNNYY